MYVDFKDMPETSKIWIYQSSREITKSEEVQIKTDIENFVNNWTAHSEKLAASFQIKYHYFIIISVDISVNDTTGCSQDALFREIQSIEKRYDLSLLDREKMAFFIDKKVQIMPLNEIKSHIKNGNINTQSIFFNNLSPFLGDLNDKWMISAGETWLKKYF